jgi:hypothetical protein
LSYSAASCHQESAAKDRESAYSKRTFHPQPRVPLQAGVAVRGEVDGRTDLTSMLIERADGTKRPSASFDRAERPWAAKPAARAFGPFLSVAVGASIKA